ncbi:MAG: choloylglycine hydrolase [Clostridia bacterium]|nr:choloylglycine hydrolase [Clostridia bacterium]
MCTAISDHTSPSHLFGRTLDLECSYGEQIVITPRAFPFHFLYEPPTERHLAMIGTAHLAHGRPLYYDAVNEAGLCVAALNFPAYAAYHPPRTGAHNVASFEFVPWLLGQCQTLDEARSLLRDTVITPDQAADDLPATPLHWMVADASGAITVESVGDGLKIYDNSVGVLTNSPDFAYHMTHLCNFSRLDSTPPQNTLCPQIALSRYSRGMGAMGLPGDASSASRFVRAVFAQHHTLPETNEISAVNRFFHVMDTVTCPRGFALTDSGRPIYTVYTSCADTAHSIYYFTTYANRRIRAVHLTDADLDAAALTSFSMDDAQDVAFLR